MAYQELLSTSNPGLIMILLDQSYSMAEPWYEGQTKAQAAALAVNRVIYEIVEACQDGEDIKNRCVIAVIGYGSDIVPLVGGMVSQVADNPLDVIEVPKKIPDGAGGLVEIKWDMPIWVKAKADNGTPMADAMKNAYELIEEWAQKHADSFPPVVINITDGQPNDMQIGRRDGSRTKAAAEKLMSLKTTDGHLLLFNAHISNENAAEIKLPNSDRQLDGYAKFLFNISSVLPDRLLAEARAVGFSSRPLARGFVYNARAETMIKLLQFGTMPTQLR